MEKPSMATVGKDACGTMSDHGGMFRDRPALMKTDKLSFATSGLFNKAKGALSSRKEGSIRSYFDSLLPTIKNQVVGAFRQNTKSHEIHEKEIESQINSKVKTLEKKQKKFDSAQNKLSSLSTDDDKYPSAEKALSLAQTQLENARADLETLLSTDPVTTVSNMFDETVNLGSKSAQNALEDVKSKIDRIVAIDIPSEQKKRENDKLNAVKSITAVVENAKKLVYVN